MLMHSLCRRRYDDLQISVDVEFVDRFRGQSWCVDFLHRRQLWIDCELVWQHFRWRYKQYHIENTIKCLLNAMVLSTLLSRIINKFEGKNIYISQISLLQLISTNSLRPSMSPLSPSKLAFQYSPESEIVPHIMQVNSSDFWYKYFICDTTMKESR